MRELVCCFAMKKILKTTYVLQETITLTEPNNDVKHVLSLTKKGIDMTKVINYDVLPQKLSDGDVTEK